MLMHLPKSRVYKLALNRGYNKVGVIIRFKFQKHKKELENRRMEEYEIMGEVRRKSARTAKVLNSEIPGKTDCL